MSRKPLGHKSYGHIAHIPGSRMGPGDHKCSDGQKRIACKKTRDKYDRIIVQEKLDGSNTGVALKDGVIIPMTRAGYWAHTSPFKMHHIFEAWVYENEKRFRDVLREGERLCGEWLLVAHGTKYNLSHEPFVAFDLMYQKHERMPYDEFIQRLGNKFVVPALLSDGEPVSVEKAMSLLGEFGFHGAEEKVEGVVWRVERSRLINRSKGNIGGRKPIVDFLIKYVRPDKIDGKYLDGDIIYNQYTNQTVQRSSR